MIVSNLLNENSNKLDMKLALKHYDMSNLLKASQEYKDYFTSNEYLEKQGKSIQIFYGKPLEIYENLSQQYEIGNVFCNEDYEPYAIKRDQIVFFKRCYRIRIENIIKVTFHYFIESTIGLTLHIRVILRVNAIESRIGHSNQNLVGASCD